MAKNLFKTIFVAAGAKLSLLLTDATDAMRYDSYIYQFLTDHYREYDTYTLVPWFDYNDDTQERWKIFVSLSDKQWHLVEIPNPFFEASTNEADNNIFTSSSPVTPVHSPLFNKS